MMPSRLAYSLPLPIISPSRSVLHSSAARVAAAAQPDEVLAWCRDGRITDVKTLTAMLWFLILWVVWLWGRPMGRS